MTCGHRPRGVGEVLALARHGGLHHTRHQRCDNNRRQTEDQHNRVSAVVVVIAVASAKERHPQEDVGEETDCDNKAEHHGGDPDVVVLHVADLVGHNALEFGIVHKLEQPRCSGHHGVLGVASSRKGVGRGVRDDVHLRHGEPVGDREVFDNAIEPRVVGFLDLVRSADRESLATGGEVLERRVRERTDDGADENGVAAAAPDVAGDKSERSDDDQKQRDDKDGVPLVRGDCSVHLGLGRRRSGCR